MRLLLHYTPRIEGVMDTIISKNIFHNNGNDLVAKVNARILDYRSTDVMDVGA